MGFQASYAALIMYQKKNLNKKVILIFLIIGLLYLPIIGKILFDPVTETLNAYGRPDFKQISDFGIRLSSWLYPSMEMREKFYDKSYSFSLYEWTLLTSVIGYALLMGIFFVIGARRSFYRKNSAVFLLFMFFFPVGFAFIFSQGIFWIIVFREGH